MRELLPESGLDTAGQAQIAERIEQLRQRIEAEPKTMRWKTRARLGTASAGTRSQRRSSTHGRSSKPLQTLRDRTQICRPCRAS